MDKGLPLRYGTITIIANMNWQNGANNIPKIAADSKRFVVSFFVHCRNDQITVTAGYLAFISLLSVVPLISVTFSILRAFPVFDDFKQSLEGFIFSNFVPTSSEQIQQYINGFVDNASQMTAIGIVALIAVALSLISSIDNTLNRIWDTKRTRKKIFSFAVYWMVLTLGPIFVGASLGVTSYVVSVADSYTPGVSDFFIKLLPFLLSTLAFVLLFMSVPNTEVKFKAALSGAVMTAVLFEVSKRVFALYITSFPSYQVIYGALASIPILFLWVYVSWVVVLLGAELTVFIAPFFQDTSQLTINQERIHDRAGDTVQMGDHQTPEQAADAVKTQERE